MRTALLLFVLAATPLTAELLETTIAFEGTGCVSCAESLEPRLARIRGVEKVELDLDKSTVTLKLVAGNVARIGPLRLRVTQDGTKILGMTAVVQGVAANKDGAWTFIVSGPEEPLGLEAAAAVQLDDGKAYKVAGKIVEGSGGELTLQASSATPL